MGVDSVAAPVSEIRFEILFMQWMGAYGAGTNSLRLRGQMAPSVSLRMSMSSMGTPTRPVHTLLDSDLMANAS